MMPWPQPGNYIPAGKVDSVTDPETHNLWRAIQRLDEAMQRAKLRCEHLADSEGVMGFKESEAAYREMAYEMSSGKVWAKELLQSLVVR